MNPGATYSLINFDIDNLIAAISVGSIDGAVNQDIPSGVLPSGDTLSLFNYYLDYAANNAIASMGADYQGSVDRNDDFELVEYSSNTNIVHIHVDGCALETYFTVDSNVNPDGDLASIFNAECNLNSSLVKINMDPNSPTYDPMLLG